MNKMKKKLTIIIPCYNVEKFVIKALESIKKQTVNDNEYEVLIVDDGSTDSTLNIINNWLNENKNLTSFKLYSKPNANWGSVINYAKEKKLINGLYVTILDADDFFDERAFEELFKIINQNKDYDLILSNFYRFKNNKRYKTNVLFYCSSKEAENKRSYSAWSIPLCKFFSTKKFYESPNLKEKVSYQDQILYHTFLANSDKIYFINKYLGYYYVQREGSSTAMQWDNKRINIWINNMNNLLSLNNLEISSYVLMMLYYCYKKSNKNLRESIKVEEEYIPLLKKSKFSWLPFGLRNIVKCFFLFLNKKIIKQSKEN